MKKFLFSILVLGVFAGTAFGQANGFRKYDINWNVLSYSRQGSLDQYGGTLGFTVHINQTWGIVADLGIHQPADAFLDFETTTYRFGPKMTYRAGNRVSAFTQFLVGGVRVSDSTSGVNGFSMLVGGGFDVGIKPWIAWRAVEAGYSGLNIDGGWSNGTRLSTGVVFRFGKD